MFETTVLSTSASGASRMPSGNPPSGLAPGEPVQVLDLPQLYQKPSAKALLSTLQTLAITPSSFADDNVLPSSQGELKDIAGYLTRIIASRLAWIEDDDEKEQVWEAASQRLSDRSGRSAMGAMNRTFEIPVGDGVVKLNIHEPTLTNDNLGFKTWGSSFVLAKQLYLLELPGMIAYQGACIKQEDASVFPRTHQEARVEQKCPTTVTPCQQQCPTIPARTSPTAILELGAGTGLLGLAAACVWRRTVLLTDLGNIVSNLANNVEANMQTVKERGGMAFHGELDWTCPGELKMTKDNEANLTRPRPGDVIAIIVADPVYMSEHPRLLVNTILVWLCRTSAEATVIIAYPIRDAYAKQNTQLRSLLQENGLTVRGEGLEMGRDDWRDEVIHSWSIWGWS